MYYTESHIDNAIEREYRIRSYILWRTKTNTETENVNSWTSQGCYLARGLNWTRELRKDKAVETAEQRRWVRGKHKSREAVLPMGKLTEKEGVMGEWCCCRDENFKMNVFQANAV